MKYITNINYDNRSYEIYTAYSYEDKIDLNGYTYYSLTLFDDKTRDEAMKMISSCLSTVNSYLYILIKDNDLLFDIDVPMWLNLKGFYIQNDFNDIAEILIKDFLGTLQFN